MDENQPVDMALINMAILLLLYSTSICGVVCVIPFLSFRIYERIDSEVNQVNNKIWQIKSLPQLPYDEDRFRERKICTICMDEFRDKVAVTYLPCDPTHYFHTHCIAYWLCKETTCPICKVVVNYDRSYVQSTTKTYEQLRDDATGESS